MRASIQHFAACQYLTWGALRPGAARLLGVFEYFYPDSAYGDVGTAPDTHYVVLCYRLALPVDASDTLPNDQHERYQWWSAAEIESSTDVREYSRAYLQVLDKDDDCLGWP